MAMGLRAVQTQLQTRNCWNVCSRLSHRCRPWRPRSPDVAGCRRARSLRCGALRRLSNPEILKHAAGARQICVGKHGLSRIWSQDEILAEMLRFAAQARRLVGSKVATRPCLHAPPKNSKRLSHPTFLLRSSRASPPRWRQVRTRESPSPTGNSPRRRPS